MLINDTESQLLWLEFALVMAKSDTGSAENVPKTGTVAAFAEAGAWRPVGSGWQPLYGSFQGLGFSVEWHDFTAKQEFDWSASFHPDCVELCLNLSGDGYVEGGGQRADIAPLSVAFYRQGEERLIGRRLADSTPWLKTIFAP